jgi:hypothetical protein
VAITGGAGVTVSTASSSITIAAAGSYVLPTATDSVLGGIKVGSGLTITDGVLAASGGGGSLSGSVTIPASGDTQWPNTVILLKGDDGLLYDATGRAWTSAGSPTLSTSVKKFGSASICFPNSPLSYLTTPRTSALEIGDDDFTLEFWLYPTAYPAGASPQFNSLLYSTRGTPAQAGFIAVMNPAGKLATFISSNTSSWDISTGTLFTTSAIPLNQWTHVALTRSGTTYRGFFNGVLEVTETLSGTPSTGTGGMFIGGDTSGERFVGYMDDVRFTKVCRWTSTFTPPTATYGTGTYAAAQTLPVVFS